MPVTTYFGVALLIPAVIALVIAGLGFARRPHRAAVGPLAALGVLAPLVALIYLQQANLSGVPLHFALFGAYDTKAQLAPLYSLDAFGFYTAYGVLGIVTPLLLWLAWRGGFTTSGEASPDFLRVERWAGVALALGAACALVSACFADNIVWLGLSWIVAVALIWGLGELGSDVAGLDWRSAAFMLAGPVLWLGAMLLAANPSGATRITALMGVGKVQAGNAALVLLTIVIAAGAYPLLGWVRRRALVSPPVGVAAVTLAALPMALVVAARSYAAMQDTADTLPTLGAVTPPLTVGLIWVILGALTVAIAGLLALGRRDTRSLIAFLATAQAGWGLVGLGVSRPVSALGFVFLLSTMIFGLGAVIAASVVEGTLAPDVEPDGAGSHPFGATLRPASAGVWLLGALSLLGTPLLGGFVSRELIAAGSVKAAQIAIPLVGLAWVGDALLALAILRAVAPAFSVAPAQMNAAVEALADGASSEVESDEAEASAPPVEMSPTNPARRPLLTVADAPGALLALAALVVAIAPRALLDLGAWDATRALVQSNTLETVTTVDLLGIGSVASQWLPGLLWIGALLLGGLAAVAVLRGTRRERAVYVAGAAPEAASGRPQEIATLSEPEDAWRDLTPAFGSSITTPGYGALITSLESESANEVATNDAASTEAEDDDPTEQPSEPSRATTGEER